MRDCKFESHIRNCMIEQPQVSFKGPWSLLSKLRPFSAFRSNACKLSIDSNMAVCWRNVDLARRDHQGSGGNEFCLLERGGGIRDSRNLCWTPITLQVQYRIYLSISSMMASLLCSCVQINEYKRKMLMFFCNLCIASGM